MFTVSLAVVACVQREGFFEAEWFVVGGWGLWHDGGDGGGAGATVKAKAVVAKAGTVGWRELGLGAIAFRGMGRVGVSGGKGICILTASMGKGDRDHGEWKSKNIQRHRKIDGDTC